MNQSRESELISSFLNPKYMPDIESLRHYGMTQRYLAGINDVNNLRQLVSALQEVDKNEAFMYLAALCKCLKIELPKHVDQDYSEHLVLEQFSIDQDLQREITELVKKNKADESGFNYNTGSRNYSFNANIFAQYFLRRCPARIANDGQLFLYDFNKGYFKEFTDDEIGRLLMLLMNDGLPNSWRSTREDEALKAIKHLAQIVVKMNNRTELLNLQDGMLDTNGLILKKHDPEYLSTVQLPINFNSVATAPRFIQFLSEIAEGDTDWIRVIQEVVGYFLCAEMKCEKGFFFHGSGSNGKSVLASVIRKLVGEKNVSSIPITSFDKNFGLAGIVDKVLNVSAENELGSKSLNTETFKALVSADPITIDRKYMSQLDYTPCCKLLFLVNNLPTTNDLSYGFTRKLMIIPFTKIFKPDEQDKDLKEKLFQELNGILNWALEGLIRLKSNNYVFSSCEKIDEAMSSYIQEINPVLIFIKDHIKQKLGNRTERPAFYNSYINWLNQQQVSGQGTRTRQSFWRAFERSIKEEGLPFNEKKIQGTRYLEDLLIY